MNPLSKAISSIWLRPVAYVLLGGICAIGVSLVSALVPNVCFSRQPTSVAEATEFWDTHLHGETPTDSYQQVDELRRPGLSIMIGRHTIVAPFVSGGISIRGEGLVESVTIRTGWPLLCMEGAMYQVFTPSPGGQPTVTDALAIPKAKGITFTSPMVQQSVPAALPNSTDASIMGNYYLLPIGIHWVAALTDSVVYALIAYILLATARELRRIHRRRCGRCPICSYQLLDLTVPGCPECGWSRERGAGKVAE
jgi:hypothetical protein